MSDSGQSTDEPVRPHPFRASASWWKELAQRERLPLLCASFVTVLYSLPQLLHSLHGGHGAFLLQEDESFYVARLVRALQGVDSMSPLLHEHQGELSLVPGFVAEALAAPFRLGATLGLPLPSPNVVVVLYRTLFAFFGVLAMVFGFVSVGLSRPLATLAALWVYVDPGIASYKPLWGLSYATVVLNRFTNPLVLLPVFFVAWGSLARAFLADRHRQRWLAVAGVTGGALFYTSFYYWTFFVAVLGMTALGELRRRYRSALAILGIALVVSLGYWLYAFSYRESPLYEAVLWRTNFLAHGRGVTFIANKTMWLFVLGAFTVWRLGTKGSVFLSLSITSGLACFYAGLVTGFDMPNSVQNGHWTVMLAPLIVAACLWSGTEWLTRSAWARFERAAFRATAAVLVLGGSGVFLRLYEHVRQNPIHGTGERNPAYEPAWSWLREHASMETVVLASERSMEYVPLATGNYIFLGTIYPDSVSFEETLERHRVLWALSGQREAEVEKLFAAEYHGADTWLWRWGLTPELARELEQDGWPALDALRWRRFTGAILELVRKTTPREITAIGRRYKVDYLVRGPEERDWSAVNEYLALTTVFRTSDVQIDHVEGWRNVPGEADRRE